MENLFELLSRLFENNNVAGIIISICLLLSLLSGIGFFPFVKKLLKTIHDIFYSIYWNYQRRALNKPISEKQKKLQEEIKAYLMNNLFLNENPSDKNYYYNKCLPGLNEAFSIIVGNSHSYILTSKNSILTRTGQIDNQNFDNRCIIKLLNDLMEKGPENLNRTDYLLQREERKEPKICKKCKYFTCSGWNF